jgi:hypothetical protein
MKKLTIIAVIACTSFFFISCESDIILPQNIESQGNPATTDFVEQEFRYEAKLKNNLPQTVESDATTPAEVVVPAKTKLLK